MLADMSSSVLITVIAIVVLPLLSFAYQILLHRFTDLEGDRVPVAAILLSLFGSLSLFSLMLRSPTAEAFHFHYQAEWFRAGSVTFGVGILIDNLTAIMLVIVTLVSSLVHIYSIGYMHGDNRYPRFFAYLGLFSFSMLGLVVCDNLFHLFCFWELVGVCSYLLIGYYFEKQSAANASLKAFITNRVGDVGFFIGIAMLYSRLGTFQLGSEKGQLFHAVGEALAAGTMSTTYLTVAGILLFMGAVGKSAQFPLHVWLPDAMEGPTPVSALIHAATMVAAGVYMTARVYPVFTPDVLTFIAYTGLITACFAGTIAVAQNDIKRVLAYSTVSQLGYMILALGVGGYVAGLFHLATHAFFKALLFLCSGSVIHSVHTQDMREMGGLRHKMPITFATMFIGTISICGLPFTAGFFSKDMILTDALLFGWYGDKFHILIFLLSWLAAGLTAFYSFRLIFMTFFGEPQDKGKYDHAHESPLVMTAPLLILAVLAITSGWSINTSFKPASALAWGNIFRGNEISEAKVQMPPLPAISHIMGIPHGELASAKHGSSAHGSSEHGSTDHGNATEEPSDHVIPAAENSAHATEDSAHASAETSHSMGALPWAYTHTLGAAASGTHHSAAGMAAHDEAHLVATVLSVLIVGLSIFLSWLVFIRGTFGLNWFRENVPPVADVIERILPILENKYYVDELYQATFINGLLTLNQILAWFDSRIIDAVVNFVGSATTFFSKLAGHFDRTVVDGAVNLLADLCHGFGDAIRRFQDGVAQDYLVYSFSVVVFVLLGLHFAGL